MARRKPGEASLTFTLAASGLNSLVYAIDVEESFEIRDFTREEWINSRLQNAQDLVSYAKPIIQTSATNSPIQVGFGDSSCGASYAVPLGPDDANINNILQRMNITTYRIGGADSSPTAVNNLFPIFLSHKQRLDKFDAYVAELGQNISYQRLIALRSETFSYLTSTGLNVSGLDISQSNCLISEFSSGTIYYNPTTGTARTRGWSATLQVITITSRANY